VRFNAINGIVVVVTTVDVDVVDDVVVGGGPGMDVVVVVLVIETVLGPVGVFVSQATATLTMSNPISSGLRIPYVSGIGNSSS
jgi:hypothetical protein